MKQRSSKLVAGCWLLVALFAGPAVARAADELPRKEAQLFELVRHLYRWYLDEDDVQRLHGTESFTFWVRELKPELDEGDRSRFAEITLPQLGVVVSAKKADYDIEELGVTVKADAFKITNVARREIEPAAPEGAEVIQASFKDMLDYLFKTRAQAEYPEGEFLERLRAAVRKELADDPDAPRGVTQVAHLSPISPVANELWVYWETGRKLIRFASDIDLANPAVWDHETLAVKTYDIDSRVVVSFDEAPGAKGFLNRDQVGRVLYNCMVFGKRQELQPPAAAAPAQP